MVAKHFNQQGRKMVAKKRSRTRFILPSSKSLRWSSLLPRGMMIGPKLSSVGFEAWQNKIPLACTALLNRLATGERGPAGQPQTGRPAGAENCLVGPEDSQ